MSQITNFSTSSANSLTKSLDVEGFENILKLLNEKRSVEPELKAIIISNMFSDSIRYRIKVTGKYFYYILSSNQFDEILGKCRRISAKTIADLSGVPVWKSDEVDFMILYNRSVFEKRCAVINSSGA